MNSIKLTPTFKSKSRKETECSESLLPQLELPESHRRIRARCDSITSNSLLQSQTIPHINIEDNHENQNNTTISSRVASITIPCTPLCAFISIWFLLWLSITIVQIYLYSRLLLTITEIDSTIQEIDKIRDDWLALKRLLCNILPIPDICSESSNIDNSASPKETELDLD